MLDRLLSQRDLVGVYEVRALESSAIRSRCQPAFLKASRRAFSKVVDSDPLLFDLVPLRTSITLSAIRRPIRDRAPGPTAR